MAAINSSSNYITTLSNSLVNWVSNVITRLANLIRINRQEDQPEQASPKYYHSEAYNKQVAKQLAKQNLDQIKYKVLKQM